MSHEAWRLDYFQSQTALSCCIPAIPISMNHVSLSQQKFQQDTLQFLWVQGFFIIQQQGRCTISEFIVASRVVMTFPHLMEAGMTDKDVENISKLCLG